MIVITGAAGIIGREICGELLRRDLNILSIVRRAEKAFPTPSISLDLSKENNISSIINGEVSCLIHLAAAVPHSLYYPDTEENANITRAIDKNIYKAAKDWGCPVIYMSTCGLYDRTTTEIKYEDDEQNIKIETPYYSAKHDGELLFSNLSRTVVMRLSAPIGHGQKSSVVISTFVELARNNQTLQLWGSGYRQQNFIDVKDVVKLLILAMSNPYFGVINVAQSKPVTMIELARTTIEAIGSGYYELSGQYDSRDMETANYSISKAFDIYEWEPGISLLDSIKNISDDKFRG